MRLAGARSALDCGSRLPLCGRRSLLRAAGLGRGAPHPQQAAATTKRQQAAAVVRCEAARSSGVQDPGHPPPLGG